jgi:hypothetical protein
MATPDRDTVYTTDGANRVTPTRESSATGWFVGIIVALALLAIGYLVFSANSTPSTTSVDVNTPPAVTAPADTSVTPSTSAPAATDVAPMTEAPAAPVDAAPAAPADAAPAGTTAPAVEAPAAPTTPAQ